MIEIVRFEAAHVDRMRMQAAQAWFQGHATAETMKGVEQGPFAVTFMEAGEPVLCGGAMAYWEHRALVWSLFSDRVNRRNFVGVHAAAERFLAALPFKRLEASVDVGFEQGHRWMRLLGFKVEAPLQEAFQVNGSDSVGYVRIKR
jgi:hypothetical protein